MRVLDYKSWQEYNKHSKEHSWRGVIVIDQIYKNEKEFEDAIERCYQLHKKRWDKVKKHLGVTETTDVPKNLVSQLDEQLAGDLREVSGKKRSDASNIPNKNKRLDMVKLAYKLNITPGDSGWDKEVVKAIEENRI